MLRRPGCSDRRRLTPGGRDFRVVVTDSSRTRWRWASSTPAETCTMVVIGQRGRGRGEGDGNRGHDPSAGGLLSAGVQHASWRPGSCGSAMLQLQIPSPKRCNAGGQSHRRRPGVNAGVEAGRGWRTVTRVGRRRGGCKGRAGDAQGAVVNFPDQGCVAGTGEHGTNAAR